MDYLKRLVLIVGGAFLSHNSCACECIPYFGKNWKAEKVYKTIEASSLVFIGDVLSRTDSTYTIKVLDVFKGEIETDTLLGHNNSSSSCSKSVTEGMWVIYTSLDKYGHIPGVNGCSMSRSISSPEFNYEPPPPGEHLDSLEFEELVERQAREQLPLHLKSWMNEYAILVAYKNQTKASEPREESGNNKLTYVAIGLALTALLVVLLKK